MTNLELLAPARNLEIGIAAIDCGADAVYIGAEGFGARKDAGNKMEDIAELCRYAHRYGARVYLTVNTILYDEELESAHSLMLRAQDSGVDAFIVQDTAIFSWEDIRVPLHASTQCAVRGVDEARFYESLGCGRIVLERQLSLESIRQIHESLPECELEFFVHGALCVCYSGQCYMSEAIAGRSANRGACIQACRSLYDLVDAEGNTLVRNKALLSLKDLNLLEKLEALANAGVVSFKIEGRLKNISYVKNCVRAYSNALDMLVKSQEDKYRRSSFGRISGGFVPNLDKTFNRGYTELWLEGRRGRWSSMDTPKSVGEHIGTISCVRKPKGLKKANPAAQVMEIEISPVRPDIVLSNGDGFCAIPSRKSADNQTDNIIGFRGDICRGMTVESKAVEGLAAGMKVYRNISMAFERELERNMPKREIPVVLDIDIKGRFTMEIHAVSEDGRELTSPFNIDVEAAENRERQLAIMGEQLSKRALHYSFSVNSINTDRPESPLPLLSAATLNSIRRLVAEDLDALPVHPRSIARGARLGASSPLEMPSEHGYKHNVANGSASALYASYGQNPGPAYELEHRQGAELMRTKYCIRYELGLCPVHQGAKPSRPLYLSNNGRRFELVFDCGACEMVVKQG